MSITAPKSEECGVPVSPPSDPLKTQLDFLWKVHDYTNNYIRFSDTNAALVIAFASGFIASLVTHDIHHPLREARFSRTIDWSYTGLVVSTLAAFVLLALSVLGAISAILPRLRPVPPEERNPWGWLKAVCKWFLELFVWTKATSQAPIFWGDIMNYRDQPSYLTAIQGLGFAEQVRQVADHLFVLAGITNAKFRLVNLSIFLAVVGGIIASLLIVFTSKS